MNSTRAAWLFCLSILCLPIPSFGDNGLTVATVERKPFAMMVDGQLVGFSVELWEALARELDRTYRIESVETFKQMLTRVQNGEVDLAIGNISITADREQVLDFSHPVFDAGLQILVPADGTSSSVVAAVFTWEMLSWVLMAIGVIFVVANLMWFFERRDSPYFQKGYREGMWPSFWYTMHVMISGGFEEHVPRSLPARLLGIVLVVCSLFLVSAFVAKITSTMTVNELRSDIRDYHDLYGKRVGTTSGSTAAAFLGQQSIRFRGFDDTASMFAELTAGRLDAVVHDAPVLQYFAAGEGRGRTSVVGELFRREKYGIAFPEDSALVEAVNRGLLVLHENGTYDEIHGRWFGDEREGSNSL